MSECLALGPGRTVLDLGAGTGKLTRLLVPSGARVVAVEPLDDMRAELERAVPEAEALAGSAEAIPLADASVDGATVAQAFHWFRLEEALAELRRVLRPGGRLALLWNEWDDDDPLTARIDALVAPLREGERTPRGMWRPRVEELFGPVDERRFPFVDTVPRERAVERVATISVVAALPDDEREALLRRVRAAVPDPTPIAGFTEVFVA